MEKLDRHQLLSHLKNMQDAFLTSVDPSLPSSLSPSPFTPFPFSIHTHSSFHSTPSLLPSLTPSLSPLTPSPSPLTPSLSSLQLKDLRSSITREACVTLSYITTVFGVEFAGVAESMMSQLIPLLPNSAKVSPSPSPSPSPPLKNLYICLVFLLYR